MHQLTHTLQFEALPPLLQVIPKPPNTLYFQGNRDILTTPCVSVVGSRKLIAYAEAVLRLFVPRLVQAGITIVSGLAYGADALAHEIALKHGGRCIAVLGSGLHSIYPTAHYALSQKILKAGGGLLTEYPPGMSALPHHFLQRNRLIAGLSRVTLVVQAGEKSGTLSTAHHAVEQGRDVCVVLGDITRLEYTGCYQLMEEGASIVRLPEQILQRFEAEIPCYAQLPLQPALTGTAATLYDCISRGTTEPAQLLLKTGLTAAQLQGALSLLELDGYITFRNSTWRIT